MSRQKYFVSGIEWRKKDGDLPAIAILDIPSYVYLDTPVNWWGPWIRDELSQRYNGKVKRYESCEIMHDDALRFDILI
jgi:hypothetical protein